MERPNTTLFMLSSVDGKISTGSTDNMDVDKDYPKIDGVKEGLQQYYDIEQTTDLWSLCSGRTQAKIGVNERPTPNKTPVSFVLIDNKNLTEKGIRYFCALSKNFVLITTNPVHPAFNVNEDNLFIILQNELDLKSVLHILKTKFDCGRITVQTGGTLNGLLLREKLIDYVDIVLAPILVGGKDTATLIDGKSITREEELGLLGALKLESCTPLENSYIRLKYKVIN